MIKKIFLILLFFSSICFTGTCFAGANDMDEAVIARRNAAPPAGGIIYRDSGSGTFSNTASPVVTKPAGTTDGDLIIVWFGSDTPHTFSALIGGWTQVGSTVTISTDSALTVVWKIASSEGASWTFTNLFDGVEYGAYGVLVYDGVDNSTPFDVASLQDTETASTTPVTDAITPTNPNCMIVSVWGFDLGAATVAPDDSPACTERVELDSPGSFGAVYGQEHKQTSAAAEAHSITISASDSSGWTLMALRPE